MVSRGQFGTKTTNPRKSNIEPSVFTEDTLARELIGLIYAERELERAKIELIKCADFNMLDLFKQFDASSLPGTMVKVELTKQDFQVACRDYYKISEHLLTSSTMTLLYDLYSKPSTVDHRSEEAMGHADAYHFSYYPMSFGDFCKIVLPTEGKYAEIVLSRQERYMREYNMRQGTGAGMMLEDFF